MPFNEFWGGEFGRTPMRENRGGKEMTFVGRDHKHLTYPSQGVEQRSATSPKKPKPSKDSSLNIQRALIPFGRSVGAQTHNHPRDLGLRLRLP